MTAHDDIRSALLQQREQLLRQVARLEDDLHWLETDVEPELVEAGQEEMLARVAARLDDHDRAELAAIDLALERIEQGSGGICATCGERIPAARRRALPTSILCVPCAAAREGPTRRP